MTSTVSGAKPATRDSVMWAVAKTAKKNAKTAMLESRNVRERAMRRMSTVASTATARASARLVW
jgi:hypothetical protein